MQPTISIEKHKSESHKQRMIIELYGNFVMPCKPTTKVSHPDANHNYNR